MSFVVGAVLSSYVTGGFGAFSKGLGAANLITKPAGWLGKGAAYIDEVTFAGKALSKNASVFSKALSKTANTLKAASATLTGGESLAFKASAQA